MIFKRYWPKTILNNAKIMAMDKSMTQNTDSRNLKMIFLLSLTSIILLAASIKDLKPPEAAYTANNAENDIRLFLW